MFRLEHGEADRSTLKKALPTLSHIQEAQSAWKDDFALNSMLRKRFRVSESPRVRTAGGCRGTRHLQHRKMMARSSPCPTTSYLSTCNFTV